MNKAKIIKIAVIVVIAIIAIWVCVHFGKKIYYKWKSNKRAKYLRGSIIESDLSYDDAQYESFAETLYNAMDGAGTDEDKVQGVFNKMKTRSDVIMLISSFGVKDGETLEEWIDGDFSASGKDEYINKVLEAKDIDYTF